MQYYTVFGRQVGAHVLSMLTLGTTFGLSYIAMSGGDKTKEQSPSLNASSKEEERYIHDFLRKMEEEDKATAKH